MGEKTTTEEIHEIHEAVGKILQWIAKKEMDCEFHKEKTEELREVVFGNGDPGLKTKVHDLEAIKKATSLLRSNAYAMGFDLVKMGVVALVVWLIFMYKTH